MGNLLTAEHAYDWTPNDPSSATGREQLNSINNETTIQTANAVSHE
jgi:hypothetical protein